MDDWNPRAYRAALEGAAFYIFPQSGLIRLAGEDRMAFLQRQTTNDIRLLEPGQFLLTVLTSPMGRILDVLTMFEQGETILLVPLPDRAEATARFLRSRIFFMDRVEISNDSQQMLQLNLIGPQAGDLLGKLSHSGEIATGQVVRLDDIGGVKAQSWSCPPYFAMGYHLLLPAEDTSRLASALAQLGAESLSTREFHTLRIEAGLPGAESELNEEFTPLEVGLQAAVSTQKGCYTGQEVIARQITYDKVTQRLCPLEFESPTSQGQRLWSEDERPAGVLTSYADSPRFGPIGLAVIKRPFDQPGIRLRVGDSNAVACYARVLERSPAAQ